MVTRPPSDAGLAAALTEAPRFRILHVLVSLSVLIALALLSWERLDWRNLTETILSANSTYVLWYMAAWAMMLVVRPARLVVMVRAMTQSADCGFPAVAMANVIATAANNVFPSRAGDLLLAVILRNTSAAKARYVVPVVILDRAIDLLAVIVAFLAGLACAPSVPAWAIRVVELTLGIVILGVGSICLVVARRRHVVPYLARMFSGFEASRRKHWVGIIADSLEGIAMSARPRVLIEVTVLTALLWFFAIGSYMLGLRAVGFDSGVAASAFALGSVTLSFLLPLSPGGIGIFHAAAVVALGLFGVPAEQALAFAIIAHGLPFVAVVILAGAFIFRRDVGIGMLRRTRG